MENYRRFPDNFTLAPELYELKRAPFHKKEFAGDMLTTELNRLLDAWATFYANLANLELGHTRYDLDAIKFFDTLSWWLGYTDHAKGTALIRENLMSYCKQAGPIRGAWGLIHIEGDTLILSTSGVDFPGYINPIVTAIHEHDVLQRIN
jgi:hypothetical protein